MARKKTPQRETIVSPAPASPEPYNPNQPVIETNAPEETSINKLGGGKPILITDSAGRVTGIDRGDKGVFLIGGGITREDIDKMYLSDLGKLPQEGALTTAELQRQRKIVEAFSQPPEVAAPEQPVSPTIKEAITGIAGGAVTGAASLGAGGAAIGGMLGGP